MNNYIELTFEDLTRDLPSKNTAFIVSLYERFKSDPEFKEYLPSVVNEIARRIDFSVNLNIEIESDFITAHYLLDKLNIVRKDFLFKYHPDRNNGEGNTEIRVINELFIALKEELKKS